MTKTPLIKICGITNENDAHNLLKYKVDILGFIVSKRNIPSKIPLYKAVKIINSLPPPVKKAVCVGAYSQKEIINICNQTKPQILQLQRSGTVEEIKQLKKTFPHLVIWKVIFTENSPDIDRIREFEKVADAIMIHSKEDEWPTGLRIARKLTKPFILAGELNPMNVGRAIDLFRPYMVDVIRGVETTTGKKDFRKVENFLQAVGV